MPWLTLPGEHCIVLQNSVQLKRFGDTFPDTLPLADWVGHSLVWDKHTIFSQLSAIILVFKSVRCVMAWSVPACKLLLDRACVLFFSVSPVCRRDSTNICQVKKHKQQARKFLTMSKLVKSLSKKKRILGKGKLTKFSGISTKSVDSKKNPTNHMEIKQKNVCFYSLDLQFSC